MFPSLETARLTLRVPTLDDYVDSAAMWADAAVTRHIGGVPFTEEDVWARLHRYVGHWSLLGFGCWIVRDRAGDFVGEVGFLDYRRTIVPKLDAPEMGWVLAPSAHGKGYATEAVRAAIAWGEAHFGHGRFVAIIDPENSTSLRVAEKVGFREETRTTYKGEPTVLFRRG